MKENAKPKLYEAMTRSCTLDNSCARVISLRDGRKRQKVVEGRNNRSCSGGISMKNFLLKVVTGIILAVILSFGPNGRVNAALITKTLDEDTRITPPGVIVATRDDIPVFKKGTVVTLNKYGEVLAGKLADTIRLPYETGAPDAMKKASYTPSMPIFIPYSVPDSQPKYRVLPFKGGTEVIFNDRGEVVKGTLSGSDESIELNPVNHILVSSGEISFHKNGMVATCTLSKASYLRPVGWALLLTENYTANTACAGLVEFKGKKPIELNEKGEVVKGTLNKDTKLLLEPDGSRIKTYEAGTTVEFDDNGVVKKAPQGSEAAS